MDTQWQRYQVFVRERADQPFANAGAVHAPDDELALENARDVFARRPQVLDMWVVPERAIYARTAEELAAADASKAGEPSDAAQTFLVFQKKGQVARETFVTHVGEVRAASAEAAMAQASKSLPGENVFVWWVVPRAAVVASAEADRASMFAPAQLKRYRNHLAYPVEPILRELKSANLADYE